MKPECNSGFPGSLHFILLVFVFVLFLLCFVLIFVCLLGFVLRQGCVCVGGGGGGGEVSVVVLAGQCQIVRFKHAWITGVHHSFFCMVFKASCDDVT